MIMQHCMVPQWELLTVRWDGSKCRVKPNLGQEKKTTDQEQLSPQFLVQQRAYGHSVIHLLQTRIHLFAMFLNVFTII